MEPSPISLAISNIKKKIDIKPCVFVKVQSKTPLYNYLIGLDHIRNVIYISAEVRPDSLDKGDGPTIRTRRYLSGDGPAHFIGKQLGGKGIGCNVFPMNEKLRAHEWKAHEDLVYSHLKQGGDRHACLEYGILTNKFFEDEISRPFRIYHSFRLYERGEIVGQPIEGMFENTSPKLTNDDYYHDQLGRTHAFRGKFEFIEVSPPEFI